ncbi:MAG: RluA family pseudouridine synthase [Candidatus Omnitrophota bacterium]|jgi:23S rRNA pseudouridine1911/1915/1917 synthase|nr:RluA family pseudouridine synthase [Candidatus Omnitrophota bacterium]
MFELIVKLEDNGKRVDNVVMRNMVAMRPELEVSRTLVQGMIGKGEILLNNKVVKPGHKVKTDDKIEIDLKKLEEDSFFDHDKKIPKAEKVTLDIIYEDDDIIIVNKPSNMVVHPACGNYSGTLVNALLNYPGFLTKFNEPRKKATNEDQRVLRPGIVHRLDKDTSGVIVVAKNGPALRKLSRQFKERTVTKKYIAIVRGIVNLDAGIIDEGISTDKRNRKRMTIDEDTGKKAVTFYHVIKRNKEKNFTVLEVMPKTGRTHQIRVHLSHIGHPVLGDVLYNGPVVKDLSRYALHAKSLQFIHPTSKKSVEFSAPAPKDLTPFM